MAFSEESGVAVDNRLPIYVSAILIAFLILSIGCNFQGDLATTEPKPAASRPVPPAHHKPFFQAGFAYSRVGGNYDTDTSSLELQKMRAAGGNIVQFLVFAYIYRLDAPEIGMESGSKSLSLSKTVLFQSRLRIPIPIPTPTPIFAMSSRLVSRPRRALHISSALIDAGGVGPARNISDIPSSARLAIVAESSPIYTTPFWDGTLDYMNHLPGIRTGRKNERISHARRMH
jgi:hypothetical protein